MALSQKASDTYGYNKTHSEGGSEEFASSDSSTTSTSNEYSSTLAYSNETMETTSKTYSNANAPEGYYRLVCAGTIHVFAVVGYDVKSSAYYVYTFCVQDDNTYDFIDYSKDTPNFNDYENGVLPFEIPYSVNEYIDRQIEESEGLVVDKNTGHISGYKGTGKMVTIPDYITLDSVNGEKEVVKITGVDKGAFTKNKNITSVKFGKYVTEIPESAFEGCTALESVTCPSVTKIGKRAFYGCSSLQKYEISNKIQSIGEDALNGVKNIVVDASGKDVVLAACKSGAKEIVLKVGDIADELENVAISIPAITEFFELDGDKKNFKELTVVSKAKTTVINGVNIENTKTVPLDIESDIIKMSSSSIKSNRWAMMISSDNVEVTIDGTVNLESTSDNAVLAKSLNIKQLLDNSKALLKVTGNLYTCKDISGASLLEVTKGKALSISEESFDGLKQDSLEWVLASDVPEGANIVATKWTYDLTTKTVSDKPTLEGYTLYKSNYVWTDYGSWSGWSDSPYYNSDSRKVETQSVPASYKTQYNYKRYISSDGKTSGPKSGYWGGKNCTIYQERGWSDSALPITGSQNSNSAGFFYLYGSAPCWYYEWTRTVVASYKTQYRYADRSKSYTYLFKKVEQKESASEIQESDSVSNVQKWVKYTI